MWIHSSLRIQECRDESEIYNYQRIQLSNNRLINGSLGGTLDCNKFGLSSTQPWVSGLSYKNICQAEKRWGDEGWSHGAYSARSPPNMTKVEGGGGVESHREPCVGLMFVLILALLLKVFQTNISKHQFKTDYGKKRATFWNSRQSYSSSQFILFCMFTWEEWRAEKRGVRVVQGVWASQGL